MIKTDKKDKILLCLLFLIGLVTVFSYGFYLDQDTEQQILYSNIKQYLSYLPMETQVEQELAESGIINISESIEKDHGIAMYYPAFGVWHMNKVSDYWGNIFWHIYTYCMVFGVGYCSFYMLMREFFDDRKVAMFTLLLAFFTPRMFAESHYNNKDMILYALLYALFYWGYRVRKEATVKNVLGFALFGALAFNAKILGAWFFGITGLYILAAYLYEKKFDKKVLGKMILCIACWFGIYVLITPACWGNLTAFFQYLFQYAVNFERWNGYILFKGTLIHVEDTGFPNKYLPTLMLYTIPVGILLLTAWGGIVCSVDSLKNKCKEMFRESGYVTVVLVAGMVPLVYAVLSGTMVYNGWRHFYFVYASMMVAVGYGIHRIFQICSAKTAKKCVHYGCMLYIAVLVMGIVLNHPQEHSYYNWLAGDGIEADYELDYWDLSIKQAYDSIKKDAAEGPIRVGSLNVTTQWGMDLDYRLLSEELRSRIQMEEDWTQADYLIVNTTYANIYNRELYPDIKAQYKLVDQITSYGNVVCEVYKK